MFLTGFSLSKNKNMNLKKEIALLAIVALPFLYLGFVWNELPDQVPMHWNMQGEIDRYGDKTELISIPFMLPVLVYLIFLIVPKIDPKNQLGQMGKKYDSLKFLLTTFMSVLAMFIIYSAENQSLTNPNYILMGIGVLYIILGNFFKTIKANYFIGIRTPWTLENEIVWKKTHQMGGILWFIGGLAIIICSLILTEELNFIVFMSITIIIAVIPIIYSFVEFKKQKELTS